MQTYVPDCDRFIAGKTRLAPDWLRLTPSLIHCVDVSAGLPASTLQRMTSVVSSTGLCVSNGCIEGGSVKYKHLAYVILAYKMTQFICIEELSFLIFNGQPTFHKSTISN